MNRRRFLGAAALPVLLQVPAAQAELTKVPFSDKVYEDALASGKPFLLDFYASW